MENKGAGGVGCSGDGGKGQHMETEEPVKEQVTEQYWKSHGQDWRAGEVWSDERPGWNRLKDKQGQ